MQLRKIDIGISQYHYIQQYSRMNVQAITYLFTVYMKVNGQ